MATAALALVATLNVIAAGCALGRSETASPTTSARSTSASAPGAVEANATVERVVDGDTIIVDLGGRRTRVRMIGFNTPESVDPRRPVECFGKEASDHLKSLIGSGDAVRLERDAEKTDRYGRTLAYVFRARDGLFLNVQMVEDGYAHTLTIPPNVTYVERFRAAERDARTAGRGLWSACPADPSG